MKIYRRRLLMALCASISIFILLTMVSTAQSDVQITLKSKNWGPDPTTDGSRATITISMNKMGSLVYVEEYYANGADGQPKFFQSNRHEEEMKDYTVSFDLIRPKSHSKQYWSLIKSKILLNREIVYEVWINTSGTYRNYEGKTAWYNNSTIDIGKGRPVIQKKDPFNPTGTTTSVAEINSTKNATIDPTATKASPAIETYAAIGTVLSVYMYSRRRGNNRL
jgi:hypothetical protein